MEDNVFTKKQEDQIRRVLDKMDKDLGLDKLNDKKDLQRLFEKVEKTKPSSPGSSGGGRGSAGGGGMNPTDIEKVPGKRQLKMKSGGSVKSSASKRADGIAVKGKTKGRMI
jgi:hypothetical protein